MLAKYVVEATERLVVEALKILAVVIVAFVIVALLENKLESVAPVADRLVVEALASVVSPFTFNVPVKIPLLPVKPLAERLLVFIQGIVRTFQN